jgi:hypothetical protein
LFITWLSNSPNKLLTDGLDTAQALRVVAWNKHPVRSGRTGCRGLVGLGVRYHDATMAFIAGHLPSPSAMRGGNDARDRVSA